PFQTECLFCRQRLNLPDTASGASVRCPKCTSFFTAARSDLLPAAGGRGGGRGSAMAEAFAAANADLAEPAFPPTDRSPVPHPLTAAALLTGAAAVVCLSVPPLSAAVAPLAGLGVAVAAAALARDHLAGSRRRWPGALSLTVSGGVLLAALFFPSLLGPTY